MANERLQLLQQKQAELRQKFLAEEKQLKEKIKQLAAQESERQRKNDTRRKIITGALALEHMAQNPDSQFARTLQRLLDEYVTRPQERELFQLPPLPPSNENPSSNANLSEQFTHNS
jgi:hypothetical protein